MLMGNLKAIHSENRTVSLKDLGTPKDFRMEIHLDCRMAIPTD
jgi:hypothetical protein